MSVLDFRGSIGALAEHSSVTWLRNTSDSLRAVSIEPWGSTIYLLPSHEYAVVTESQTGDPPPGASLDFDDPYPITDEARDEAPAAQITIWPEGTRSNRIYRADGNLVWDDATPSEASLSDGVISVARHLACADLPVDLDAFNRTLADMVGWAAPERTDPAFLLVEHGILGLDENGKVMVLDGPIPAAAEPQNHQLGS